MPSPQFTFTDEYFAIAHHPDTCEPRQHPMALGFGLAAGLLCELTVGGWIDVADDKVWPARQAGVPEEPLQHRLLNLVREEAGPLPVDDWLRYLAREAPELVGDRLVLTRRYRRETARVGVLRRPVRRYRPVDWAAAAYSVSRLRTAVLSGQLSLAEGIVVGIALATELMERLELADEHTTRKLVAALPRRLPPPVWHVVAHTQACVAHHVMTR